MPRCWGKGEEFQACSTFWDLAACFAAAAAYVSRHEAKSERPRRRCRRRLSRCFQAPVRWAVAYELPTALRLVPGPYLARTCADAKRRSVSHLLASGCMASPDRQPACWLSSHLYTFAVLNAACESSCGAWLSKPLPWPLASPEMHQKTAAQRQARFLNLYLQVHR